eukprot:m.261172 g.261172  ORF g.261172 m.261172 type:complete len:175 (-) comp19222_c0_seq7:588-1112(-)
MSEPMSVLFVSFFSPSSPPPFFFLFLFVLPALCRDDTTGTHVWAASLVFARWIVSLRQRLAGASVCELGAGCGVPGLVTGLCTDANEVLVTDLFAHTVDNLRHNVSLNLDLEGKVGLGLLAPCSMLACVCGVCEGESWREKKERVLVICVCVCVQRAVWVLSSSSLDWCFACLC